MPANRASKPQPAKRGRPPNSVKPKDERTDLRAAMELSRPGGHLKAVIDLYTSDLVKQKRTCNQVRRCIETGLKNKVKVTAFGSMVTGLALKESNIDLYVRASDDSPMSQEQLYALIMTFLCSTDKNSKFTETSKVRRTRTPIIQSKHKPSRLIVYIHVSHPNGSYNTEFIGDVMRRDEKLRDMTLFLKIWAKYLTESCRLGSYCLISMIIVSLQVQGFMPSIQWIQSSCLPDNVRGINYSYNLNLAPPIPPKINTLDLIGHFFDLYSTIDFEKKAMSPFLGRILDKQSILDGDIREYEAQLLAMEADDAEPPSPFRLITCMYVQDPFELHSNVAQTVCPPSLSEIKSWLSLASKATKNPELRANPKKLYEYLLFGMADELAPKEEEKPSLIAQMLSHTSKNTNPSSMMVPSCPKRPKIERKIHFKRSVSTRKSGGFLAKRCRFNI